MRRQLRPGDRVWAYDHALGTWELRDVTHALRGFYDGDFVTIDLGDLGSITATGNHPIWVADGENLDGRTLVIPDELPAPGAGRWGIARELRVGDYLLTKNGHLVRARGMSVRQLGQIVYNVSVDGLSNYAVGPGGLLAHNAKAGNGEGTGPCNDPSDNLRDRGSHLGQEQGRDFRTDNLEVNEFDPNQPKHVRGWLKNERRRIASGNGSSTPRNPPGYVQAHGRTTPAREGYDYTNSRLQGKDLNDLEERVRRRKNRR
jgi:hypothetical protein